MKGKNTYSLSSLQKGLVLHSLHSKIPGVYINQIMIDLHEELFLEDFWQACLQAISDFASLRSYFVGAHVDSMLQTIDLSCGVQEHFIDLAGFSGKHKKGQLAEYASQDRLKGFDISTPPLFRFTVIKMAPEKYTVLFTFHHLILDNDSSLKVLESLFDSYEANRLSRPIVKIFDNTVVAKKLHRMNKSKERIYWQKLLQGFVEVTPLPGNMIGQQRAGELKRIVFEVSAKKTSKVKKYVKAHGITANILIQGLWGLLLGKYSNTDDVVFGSVRAFPRNYQKSNVGIYINTLPVRVKLSPGMQFIDYLQQIKVQHKRMRCSLFTSLLDIQGWSNVPRERQLFSTVIDYKPRTLNTELKKKTKLFANREVSFCFDTHYPLLLEVFGDKSSFCFRINYDSKLFDEKEVRNVINHFLNLFDSILAPSEPKLFDISMLTAQEWSMIVDSYNRTAVDYPKNETLAELFLEQVQRTPGKIALEVGKELLSYRELARRACQLAGEIDKFRLREDDCIAVFIERSVDMVVMILGALIAGQPYIPLSMNYPLARINYILTDTKTRVIVTSKRLINKLPPQNGNVIFIEDCDATCRMLAPKKNSIANVIYTSGSTGSPKGVVVKQSGIVNVVTNIAKRIGFGSSDVLLSVTDISFDIVGLELFMPLIYGARLIVATEHVISNGKRVRDVIASSKVTVLQATPSMWRMIISDVQGDSLPITAISGGEVLTRELAIDLLKSCKSVWNFYGPTETTIWSTGVNVVSNPKKNPSIGGPLANTQIYILDKLLQPVAHGIAGGIYIGGDGVSSGYINNKKLTSEKFIANLFQGDSAESLYRTGDIGCWDKNGEIQFLGRKDNQIKLHGYRIELSEIEGLLSRHNDISQAVVVLTQDDGGHDKLVAYYTSNEGASLSDIALRKYMALYLPQYMLPHGFVHISKFVLTANGKINIQILQQGSAEPRSVFASAVASPQHELLLNAWKDVLRRDDIDCNDNFFELGGHSLLVAAVITRIEALFSISISLAEFFSYPTVNALIEYFAVVNDAACLYVEDKSLARRDIKLSSSQEGLWYISKLGRGDVAYSIPAGYVLKGELNLGVLQDGINRLLRKHVILRTQLLSKQHVPYQHPISSSGISVKLNVLDVGEVRLRSTELKNIIRGIIAEPLLLSKDLLWSVNVLRISDRRHVLLLNFHHIIFDEWSLMAFVRELTATYNSLLSSDGSVEELLPSNYLGYVEWQNSCIKSNAFAAEIEYWQKKLTGLPQLQPLSADFSVSDEELFVGDLYVTSLPNDLTLSLREFSKRYGVTTFTVLLSTLYTLLYRFSTQDDLVVATPIANRLNTSLENMLGLVANTVVLRQNIDPAGSCHDLLMLVQKNMLEAFANSQIPYQEVIKVVNSPRNGTLSTLHQIMLVVQNTETTIPRFQGVQASPLLLHNGTAKCALTLYADELDSILQLKWEYNSQVFAKEAIQNTAEHFILILQSFMSNMDMSLSQLPVVTKRDKIFFKAVNNTRRVIAGPKTIHRLFERSVATHRNNVAVVYGLQVLTYDQLNRKANILARHLLGLKVTNKTVIAISFEPCIDMLVTIIALLKIGAKYVPLDPSAPRARLDQILLQIKPKFIISSAWLKDQQAHAAIDYADTNLRLGVTADQDAIVIYTSGSTGKPKGVACTHRALCNRLLWMRDKFKVNDRSIILHKTPYIFDVSLWELFLPIVTGGKLIIAPAGANKDPGLLRRIVDEQKVTLLHFVPSLLEIFLGEESLLSCNSLKDVCCSGEVLTLETAKKFYSQSHARLHNLYGPTEAAIDVTHYRCPRSLPIGNIPIGSAIDNIRLYVLDVNKSLVPIGAIGELYIGGVGLARCYYKEKQLTDFSFQTFTVASRRERRYRTGDLVRWSLSGKLQFVGRIDGQVKINGVRIETAEIELYLQQYEAVESVCVVTKNINNKKALVAYVVAEKPGEVTGRVLREFLLEKLPLVAVPTSFIFIDKMPLSPTGKLDRAYLHTLTVDVPSFESQTKRSINEHEKVLLKIWTEVLGGQLGVESNYFAYGGDSIRSVRILGLLQEEGYTFSLADFFRYQTIVELAPRLKKLGKLSHKPASFSLLKQIDKKRIDKTLIEDAYSLSRLQAGMLFHTENMPDTSMYLDIFMFKVSGAFKVSLFKEALNFVIKKHPVLRTSFNLHDYSVPLQLVHRNINAKLSLHKLSVLDAESEAQFMGRAFNKSKEQKFNRETPGLYHISIYANNVSKQFYLIFSMHHVILDGWSVATLIAEILNNYSGLLDNKQLVQRDIDTNFAEFIRLEELDVKSRRRREYWANDLAEYGINDFPLQAYKYQDSGIYTKSLEVIVPNNMVGCVKQISRSQGCSEKNIYLAVHLAVLQFLYGKKDVITGYVLSGRQERALSDEVLGLFLNTAPFRINMSSVSWEDLIGRVVQKEVKIFPNRRYPLAEIKNIFEERGELYNTVFNYTKFHPYAELNELKNLSIEGFKVFEETNIDLFVNFIDNPISKQVELKLNYNANKISSRFVSQLAEYYITAIALCTKNVHALFNQETFLTRVELELITKQQPPLATNHVVSKSFCQQFSEVSYAHANKIAVRYNNIYVTYCQLYARSSKFAQYLRKHGVRRGDLVGIYLPRNLSFLEAILGALMLNAAYVPIDVNYPIERVVKIITDSGLKVLTTETDLAKGLAALPVKILCLDVDQSAVDSMEPVLTYNKPNDQDLAYVLYTSGSTGEPKGVAITHGNLQNFLGWAQTVYSADDCDKMLAATSFSFDLAVFETLFPLSIGGSILLVKSIMALAEQETDITLINTVPSALAALLDSALLPPSVKIINLAGEKIPADLIAKAYGQAGVTHVYNLYGPTECTTYSSCKLLPCDALEVNNIGKPIANTQMYVLDENNVQVLPGVVGELYIGGKGVASGYLNQDGLTNERFVPSPYEHNDRLYRTGDLVVQNQNMELIFLGRADNQVKIRGYRVELDEISELLKTHQAVKNAITITGFNPLGQEMIVSYFVKEDRYKLKMSSYEEEQLAHWKNIYNDLYSGEVVDEMVGWVDSFQKQPFSEQVMGEFYDAVVQSVLDLKPVSILEIGCGTGMLLKRLHRHCNCYYATDISDRVISNLASRYSEHKNIILKCLHADKIESLPSNKFDVVILNSVVQYFPSLDYLDLVFSKIRKVATKNAKIYIGDVRNLLLLDLFHASAQINRAKQGDKVNEIYARFDMAVRRDYELVISPIYFLRLQNNISEIHDVEIQLKKMASANEISKYRYDVVIYLGEKHNSSVASTAITELNPNEIDTLESFANILKSNISDVYVVRSLPNQLLGDDPAILSWMKSHSNSLTVKLRHYNKPGWQFSMIPQEIRKLAAKYGYFATISPRVLPPFSNFDVLLTKSNRLAYSLYNLDATEHVNILSNGPLERGILAGNLQLWLKKFLPLYMKVDALFELASLPTTASGKVNLRLLKTMVANRLYDKQRIFTQPTNEIENILVRIWAGVFHMVSISTDDNFFDLGGDSIIGLQISAKARKQGLYFTPEQLFRTPSIRSLSDVVVQSKLIPSERVGRESLPVSNFDSVLSACGISVDEIERIVPATHIQEAIMFHALYDKTVRPYVNGISLVILDEIDLTLFDNALQEMYKKYEVLRSGFLSPKHSASIRFVLKAEGINSIGHVSNLLEVDKPPLFIVSVSKIADKKYALKIIYHHVILDGWSIHLFLSELFKLYNAFKERSYVCRAGLLTEHQQANAAGDAFAFWMRNKKDPVSQEFWVNYMGKYKAKGEFCEKYSRVEVTEKSGFDVKNYHLSKKVFESITSLLRPHGLTVASFMAATWSLLLISELRTQEICFGLVYSGRSAPIDGIEDAIGMFINTLPFKVKYESDACLIDFLRAIQQQIMTLREHEHDSLAEVARIISGSETLQYETILDIINYPASYNDLNNEMKIADVGYEGYTQYPLTVLVSLQEQATINFIFDCDKLSAHKVDKLGKKFLDLLAELSDSAKLRNRVMLLENDATIERKRFGKREDEVASNNVNHIRRHKTSWITALVISIWSELFGDRKILPSSHFFSLGGNSLIALKFISALNRELNVYLPIKYLYDNPVLEDFCSVLFDVDLRELHWPIAQVNLEDRFEPFPLTDLQFAYWADRQDIIGNGAIATHIYYEFDYESLDLHRLGLALNKLIMAQPMLRVVVVMGEQRILKEVPRYTIQASNFNDDGFVRQRLTEQRLLYSHQVVDATTWPLFAIAASIFSGVTRLHISLDALIFDNQSVQIFFSQWQLLYENKALPAISSYRDYVLTYSKYKDSWLYDRDKKYWLSLLANMPLGPVLPMRSSPRKLKSIKFSTKSSVIKSKIWRIFKKQARSYGITPNAALLTAFAITMARWSKQKEFTINLTMFNRLPLLDGIEQTIGNCASTLLYAVPADVAQDDQVSFVQIAKAVQEKLTQDLTHRMFSGVEVSRELLKIHPDSLGNISPIVFTSTVGDSSLIETFLPDYYIKNPYTITQTPHVWLDCQLFERGESLVVRWDYLQKLFYLDVIKDMFNAFLSIVHSIVGMDWSDITPEFLSAEQLHTIDTVNAQPRLLPAMTVAEGFVASANRHKKRTALIANDESITYQQLYLYANNVASKLLQNGLQPNAIVALLLDKSWQQLGIALGVMMAGGVYLPMSTGWPSQRIEKIVNYANPFIILGQSQYKHLFCGTSFKKKIRYFDVDSKNFLVASSVSLSNRAAVTNAAYVIFTSGSTGMPKGVTISHQAMMNTLNDINERFNIAKTDKILAISDYTFDLSVYDYFGVLLRGGCVVIPTSQEEKIPKA